MKRTNGINGHNKKDGNSPMRRSKLPSQFYKEQELNDTIVYDREVLEKILNENMKKFCRFYIERHNGTRSYMKAYGYDLKDKSRYFTAAANASFLLKIPKIKQYIDFLKQDIEVECKFSKIGLLKELVAVAFSNLPDMYESWVTLGDLEELKNEYPELSKSIKEISTKVEIKLNALKEPVEVQYVKIVMHDKLSAIREIFQIMGWKEATKLDVTILQPLFPDVQY